MDEALARDPEKNTAAYLQWAIEEHREAEAGADMGAGVNAAMVEDAGMLAFARGEQPSEDSECEASAGACWRRCASGRGRAGGR